MKEKNPTIERDYNREPGKRLYFYPKHKTVAQSEEEAKRKKLVKVEKPVKAEKPKLKKQINKSEN